jgi:hypothetical protein
MINFGSPSQPQRGNVGMAVLVGLVVAIACAVVWGVISYATKYQISIMAILVGLAVGTVMSRIGRVRTPAFGVATAVIAVFGCALGSLVAEILVINRADGVPLSLILILVSISIPCLPPGVGGLGFVFWRSRRCTATGSDGRLDALGLEPPDAAPALRRDESALRHDNQPYAPGQQPARRRASRTARRQTAR